MAAAGAGAKPAMWIARKWREGWEKIPVIMLMHSLTTPIIVVWLGSRILYGRPEVPVQKYRNKYTVVRPGDPRIANINNYSDYDRVGFFS